MGGVIVRPPLRLSNPPPWGSFLICSCKVAALLVFCSFSEEISPHVAVDSVYLGEEGRSGFYYGAILDG